jgi:hypothetical protein
MTMTYTFANTLFDTPKQAARCAVEEFLLGSGGAGGMNSLKDIEDALKLDNIALTAEMLENEWLPQAVYDDDFLTPTEWRPFLMDALDDIRENPAKELDLTE